VREAIDLDRELRAVAVKVQDVRPDGVLAAELQSTGLATPKRYPEERLRRGQIASQSAGATDGLGWRFHPGIMEQKENIMQDS
jgi:hypothetical protein